MAKIEFSAQEKKVLKEYSSLCLVLSELKEKTTVCKKAKKMYETTGTTEFPVSIQQILDGKVPVGEGVKIREVGVELINVKKKQTIPLSKPEIQKRLQRVLEETAALVAFDQLTDKRFRQQKEVHKIECKILDNSSEGSTN